jgi:predicted AlkP superfamily phosphohydrolase/phosphomutase
MATFLPYERVIILALDSVCWEVLGPLVQDGTMSALGAFLRKANYGVLESTVPPHTAAAWTTFLTGKDPGKHGIIDFVRFDPAKHKFRFHDSFASQSDSIFTRLSNAGVSCGSIFLPRNYPPFVLKDGYVISGFETPGTHSNFTHPEDIREEILGISPDLHFNFEDDWEEVVNDEAFARNIDRAIESADLLESIAVHFQRERPVQLQIAYLQATDILFHKAWRWCDPKTGDSNPARRTAIKKFFRRIDQLLNRVMGLHSSASQRMRAGGGSVQRTLRLICSDHGHGPSLGRIFVNNLLEQWGYLKPLSGLMKASHKLKLLTMSAETRRTKSREMALDWSATKAYMAHVGIYGFIYMNLRGREPQGCVTPENFERERSTLIDKFLAEKIPGTKTPLFSNVFKGEDIYSRKQELNLPDLIVVPADGFYPRKKLTHGNPVRVTPNYVGGIHRPSGIYAFEGDNIVSSNGIGPSANIADIAPTLLAALGEPIPMGLSGKPMLRIFKDQPPTSFVVDSQPKSGPQPDGPDVYSNEEQQEVEKRLADLGYLE